VGGKICGTEGEGGRAMGTAAGEMEGRGEGEKKAGKGTEWEGSGGVESHRPAAPPAMEHGKGGGRGKGEWERERGRGKEK